MHTQTHSHSHRKRKYVRFFPLLLLVLHSIIVKGKYLVFIESLAMQFTFFYSSVYDVKQWIKPCICLAIFIYHFRCFQRFDSLLFIAEKKKAILNFLLMNRYNHQSRHFELCVFEFHNLTCLIVIVELIVLNPRRN